MAQRQNNGPRANPKTQPEVIPPAATTGTELPIVDGPMPGEERIIAADEHGAVTIRQPNWFVRAWRATTGWFSRLFRKTGHGIKTGYQASSRVLVSGWRYTIRGGQYVVLRTGMLTASLLITTVESVFYIGRLPWYMVTALWEINKFSYWTKSNTEILVETSNPLIASTLLRRVRSERRQEEAVGRRAKRERERVARSRRGLSPATV